MVTWYPAYLEGDGKQEVVDFINIQRPDANTGHVSGSYLKWADTMIFSYLYKNGDIKVTYNGVSGTKAAPVDQLNLLWGATIAYVCEELSYRGFIHYNVGGIQESRVGAVATKFMQMAPMFFMQRGPSSNVNPLMPFLSFKQQAESFLDTYIKLFNNDSAIYKDRPVVTHDPTSRGYGAIEDLDVMNEYDDELSGA